MKKRREHYCFLPLSTQVSLINEIKNAKTEKRYSRSDVSRKFNLTTEQVSYFWKRRISIMKNDAKIINGGKYSQVEKSLYEIVYFFHCHGQHIPDNILSLKATKIADTLELSNFKISNKWLQEFKKEFGLYVDFFSQQSVFKLHELNQKFALYPPSHIFRLTEVGCFLPPKRITTILCVNSDSTIKIPLGVVGDERFYCNIVEGINYYFNRSSWISSNIIAAYLKDCVLPVLSSIQGIKLLILDNIFAHHHDQLFLEIENLQVFYLHPSNNSPIIDQQVCNSFRNFLFTSSEFNKSYTLPETLSEMKTIWKNLNPVTSSNHKLTLLSNNTDYQTFLTIESNN